MSEEYRFDEEGLCTVELVDAELFVLGSYLENGVYKLRVTGTVGTDTKVPAVSTFNFKRWLNTINQDDDDKVLAEVRYRCCESLLIASAAAWCEKELDLPMTGNGVWTVAGTKIQWMMLDGEYLIYRVTDAAPGSMPGPIGCAYLTESDYWYEPTLEIQSDLGYYYPGKKSELLYNRHVGASYFCYLAENSAKHKPPIIEDEGKVWDGSGIDPTKLLFWDGMRNDYSATLNLSNGIH